MLIELSGRWLEPELVEVVEEYPNPDALGAPHELPFRGVNGFVLLTPRLKDSEGAPVLINSRHVREVGPGTVITFASGRELRVVEGPREAARALIIAKAHVGL